MTASECAAWCDVPHGADEPCQTEPYELNSITADHELRAVLHQGEDGEPILTIEELLPSRGRFVAVQQFTAQQAVVLRDAVANLVCASGACGCCHGSEEEL